MFDLRFQTPSTFILSGASMSGKTQFAMNLLRHADQLFKNPQCKQNIIYYYKEWQPSYDVFKTENIVSEWVHQLPTVTDLKERTSFHKETGSIIVIDDFGSDLSRDISEIFTIHAHHTNTVVILIVQNLFLKNFRDISLNSTYIVLFKNVRDKSQVTNYLKQFQPNNSKWLSDAFQECTKLPYSYMLFDHDQIQLDALRCRGDIIPNDRPMTVWFQDTCTTT